MDSASTGGPAFTVRIDLVGGRLELQGELDLRAAHLVHDAVSALLGTDCERWVVDVAGLTGGEHALRVIGSTYRRALRHRRRMTLVGAPPWLQRALARMRLDRHLLGPGEGPTGFAHRISD